MIDNVNHPSHYNQGSVETIDFIEAVIARYPAGVRYHLGNVIKYVCRAPHKNGEEDLKKAQWYLNRALKDIMVAVEDTEPRLYTIDYKECIHTVYKGYESHKVAPLAESFLTLLATEKDNAHTVLELCLRDLQTMVKNYE